MPGTMIRERRPVEPTPRPGSERPLVDFKRLDIEIGRMLHDAQKHLGRFPEMPKAKRVSKTRMLARAALRGQFIVHPLKFWGQAFSTKKAGLVAYGKDRKRVAKIAELRQSMRVEERVKAAYMRYENALRAAASRLEGAVADGTINQHNANYLKNELFDTPTEKARQAFRGEVVDVINEYRKELVDNKLIYKHPGGYPVKSPPV